MDDKRKLVTYCGLYCGDCSGYSQDIAKVAQKLNVQLERYKYDLTVKAMFSKQFKDLDQFKENLIFLTQMK